MTEIEEDWDAQPDPPTRKGGRRANPNINWALAEKLYVEGELVGDAEHVRRVYPGPTEIARRAGTTKSNLCGHIYRFDWRKKRDAFQHAHGVIPAVYAGGVQPGEPSKPRKLKARDPESILTAYIDAFATALEKNEVRLDTIADLDKAIRLLAFVRGQAESTKHTHVTVSLDVMQRRHRELRQQVTAIDDDVAGVLGGGTPLLAAAASPGDEEDEGEAWDADPTGGAHAAE